MFKKILTNKEYQNLSNEYDKVKIKCKHCGHKSIVPVWVDKKPCNWCNNYVFRDEKKEFIYRIKEKIKQNDRNMERYTKI